MSEEQKIVIAALFVCMFILWIFVGAMMRFTSDQEAQRRREEADLIKRLKNGTFPIHLVERKYG